MAASRGVLAKPGASVLWLYPAKQPFLPAVVLFCQRAVLSRLCFQGHDKHLALGIGSCRKFQCVSRRYPVFVHVPPGTYWASSITTFTSGHFLSAGCREGAATILQSRVLADSMELR